MTEVPGPPYSLQLCPEYELHLGDMASLTICYERWGWGGWKDGVLLFFDSDLSVVFEALSFVIRQSFVHSSSFIFLGAFLALISYLLRPNQRLNIDVPNIVPDASGQMARSERR
ncbi:hypothetical protein DFH29DRAFT_876104 [Suillus ampliporus]|nr:hypothetical protein DFH29DRAFT_876104 [Suillus ampliporus]